MTRRGGGGGGRRDGREPQPHPKRPPSSLFHTRASAQRDQGRKTTVPGERTLPGRNDKMKITPSGEPIARAWLSGIQKKKKRYPGGDPGPPRCSTDDPDPFSPAPPPPPLRSLYTFGSRGGTRRIAPSTFSQGHMRETVVAQKHGSSGGGGGGGEVGEERFLSQPTR